MCVGQKKTYQLLKPKTMRKQNLKQLPDRARHGCFREFEAGPRFLFRSCCDVYNIVFYCTAIYREFIVWISILQWGTDYFPHSIQGTDFHIPYRAQITFHIHNEHSYRHMGNIRLHDMNNVEEVNVAIHGIKIAYIYFIRCATTINHLSYHIKMSYAEPLL